MNIPRDNSIAEDMPATLPWGSMGTKNIGGPALVLIAIEVPGLLISAGVVWGSAAIGGGPGFALEVLLAWLLSGVLVFARPVEDLVAKKYMRLRRPSAREAQRLEAAWGRVCRQAGVKPGTFTLWIEEINQENAFASGGHIVGVTRRALIQMEPRQLEGMLAHELGHHLKGHAWVGLLFFWYALPGRVACDVFMEILSRSVSFAARVPSLINSLPIVPIRLLEGAVLLFLGVLLLALSLLVLASPALLVLAVMPYLQAAMGRQAELQADLVALRLGYGPGLLKFFYRIRDSGEEAGLRYQDRRSRMLATHPTVEKRIDRLETRLLEPWSRRMPESIPPKA